MDWPSWRGPEQNGITRETGVLDSWAPKEGPGSNFLWMNEELAGISTPIVMGGKLYTLVCSDHGTIRESESVICVDAATGEKLWQNRFNVYLSDVPAERVGWANCTGDPETGRVFAMGVATLLQCLDGDSGETIWARSLSEEYGMLSTYGGRTNTPVLFENLVIISGVTTGWGPTARPAHRILALDKNDGQLVWLATTELFPEDTTYSTPIVTVLNGQAALVLGAGDGYVYAMQPRTGKVIWRYHLSRRGINHTPLVHDNVVYVGHSEENVEGTSMGALVAIDGRGSGDITKTGEIWRIDEMPVGRSSPVLLDGRLYAIDDFAGFHVLDAKTGEQIARTKLGTMARPSLLAGDGKIFVNTVPGLCYVLEITERGVSVLTRQRLPRPQECIGSPILSHGRLYLPTTGGLYCFGPEQPQTSLGPRPQPPAEQQGEETASQLRLTPAEALIEPGQTLEMTAAFFNELGQPVSAESSALEYSVTGGGEIDAQGRFTAAGDAAHAGAVITARAGDLAATARVRIVPPLPWEFDFSERRVPPSWIGAAYRHEPRDVDGEPMLVKITTIPKGTRSQSWMGSPEMSDYTIQAEVQGGIRDEKMPDIGLIAQRYTLDMRGEHQQLQIRTWPPQLRMAQTVPFPWKPNVWYIMKLQARVENGEAVLRGKVWPKDDEEPAEWTLTATDPLPNLTGSPGLFGNATNAEIFYDNIEVRANQE